MLFEIKVPAVGESISEATIGSWTKKSGEKVKRNEVLLLLETDKASVEVVAEHDGVLTTMAEAGQVVKIGAVVGQLDTEAKDADVKDADVKGSDVKGSDVKGSDVKGSDAKGVESKGSETASKTPPPLPPVGAVAGMTLSPAVNRIVHETGIDPATISGTGKGGRITKGDLIMASEGMAGVAMTMPAPTTKSATVSAAPAATSSTVSPTSAPITAGDKHVVPMTTFRKRIAERLVESQQTTATLTTFNEIDMTKILEIRAKYKDKFKEKYGINLGFMGFFAKATIEALKAIPAVNAYIVGGNSIEYHNYFNIGVAVSTEKGLMVPVIKNAGNMSIAQIELAIRDFAAKARDGKITVDDLNGGTFSITNGGVFGSLMSTPILNPPQSAILGMHKLEDRAVVIDKKIEVRTMMYVAMSYDHRIIDGKEAVGFLVKIKEGVEDPERLLIEV